MTIEEAALRVGSRITYRPSGSTGERDEHGTIERVTALFVFVRYDGDAHAKATAPQDLVS